MEVDYLGEGASDEVIARRLISLAGYNPGRSYNRGVSGKHQLDRRIAGLNAGAAFGPPVLVLRDKDEDAACAGDLVAKLLPNRQPRLLLRICVSAAEAWLMADRQAYARYCGVAVRRVPAEPEKLPRPKDVLLGWIDAHAASRAGPFMLDYRRRGVPDWRSLGIWHSGFAEMDWNPERAAASGAAPSLKRAIQRLRELAR